jgi:hypothetical protein
MDVMLKVTQAVVALRETPSDTAPHPARTVILNDIVVKLADANVPGWIRVRVLGSNPPREGFIHLSDVAEQQVDTTVDADRFIVAVGQSARSAGTNPFYLLCPRLRGEWYYEYAKPSARLNGHRSVPLYDRPLVSPYSKIRRRRANHRRRRA